MTEYALEFEIKQEVRRRVELCGGECLISVKMLAKKLAEIPQQARNLYSPVDIHLSKIGQLWTAATEPPGHIPGHRAKLHIYRVRREDLE